MPHLYRMPANIVHSVLSTYTPKASLIGNTADPLCNFVRKNLTSSPASSSTKPDIVLLPKPNSRRWRRTNFLWSCQNSSSVSNRPRRTPHVLQVKQIRKMFIPLKSESYSFKQTKQLSPFQNKIIILMWIISYL